MAELPRLILLLETSLEFGRGLLRGISRYTHLHGPWSLRVEPGHFSQALPEIGTSERCGIIARVTALEEAEAISRYGCPAVVLETSSDHLASENEQRGLHEIRTDSPAIARMAADHLMGLGLKRFAYVGYAHCPWSKLRQDSFAACLEAHGFGCAVFPHPSPIGDEHDSNHLQAWLKSLAGPVGMMACNDMCGSQVLRACNEAGIAVPDQVAVIGVDNDELICALSDPPLSSIALGVEQAGYAAAELLARLMDGRGPVDRQVLLIATVGVVARRSTEPVIAADAAVAGALRFIRDHVGRLTGVPDVCNHFRVSRRTLERAFNRALGHGVYEEITRSRLARAKRLLEETELPAYRIAELAAFGGIQPMMRLFRKRENCTPLEYRLRARRSK